MLQCSILLHLDSKAAQKAPQNKNCLKFSLGSMPPDPPTTALQGQCLPPQNVGSGYGLGDDHQTLFMARLLHGQAFVSQSAKDCGRETGNGRLTVADFSSQNVPTSVSGYLPSHFFMGEDPHTPSPPRLPPRRRRCASPARSECDTLVSKIRGLSLVSDMSL